MPKKIRLKDRDAIIQSLRAGVVPRRGLHHIQVGRSSEVKALMNDIDRIVDGGSAIRFVIGEYGAGKTFFLNLIRMIALEKGIVTIHADLSPDRRLQATGGQAQSLYSELMRNMSTRTRPDGGALPGVVERFVSKASQDAQKRGIDVNIAIQERLDDLSEIVGGYDFAEVISKYWHAHEAGDDSMKRSVLKWLRAEFTTRTDSRNAVGVRTFIDDSAFYDSLKLMSKFCIHAGYKGLFVLMDEMVNLHKITHSTSRNANYEQILRILNDSLQGSSESLAFVFAGTPEFLLDTRRGLYSYEALQSRLALNPFSQNNLVDFSGPVLSLANLTPEDIYVLLTKLYEVFVSCEKSGITLPENAIEAFMNHCNTRIGESYFRTPRTTIKSFMNLLAILDQNPGTQLEELIGNTHIEKDTGQVNQMFESELNEDDEFASFSI